MNFRKNNGIIKKLIWILLIWVAFSKAEAISFSISKDTLNGNMRNRFNEAAGDSFSIINYTQDTLRFDSVVFKYETTIFPFLSWYWLYFLTYDASTNLVLDTVHIYVDGFDSSQRCIFIDPDNIAIPPNGKISCKNIDFLPYGCCEDYLFSLTACFILGKERESLVFMSKGFNLATERTNKNNSFFTVTPNPFNPSTLISFSNPNRHARISIFNSNGKIVEERNNVTGTSFVWDAKGIASGVYVLKITNGGKVLTKALVLQR